MTLIAKIVTETMHPVKMRFLVTLFQLNDQSPWQPRTTITAALSAVLGTVRSTSHRRTVIIRRVLPDNAGVGATWRWRVGLGLFLLVGVAASGIRFYSMGDTRPAAVAFNRQVWIGAAKGGRHGARFAMADTAKRSIKIGDTLEEVVQTLGPFDDEIERKDVVEWQLQYGATTPMADRIIGYNLGDVYEHSSEWNELRVYLAKGRVVFAEVHEEYPISLEELRKLESTAKRR
jgi:hypothetical protein